MSQHVFVDAHERVEVVNTAGIKNFFGFGLFHKWKKGKHEISSNATAEKRKPVKQSVAFNKVFDGSVYIAWNGSPYEGNENETRLQFRSDRPHEILVVGASKYGGIKHTFGFVKTCHFRENLGAFSPKKDVLVCIASVDGNSTFFLFFLDPTTHTTEMKYFKITNPLFTDVDKIYDVKFENDRKVVLLFKDRDIIVELK